MNMLGTLKGYFNIYHFNRHFKLYQQIFPWGWHDSDMDVIPAVINACHLESSVSMFSMVGELSKRRAIKLSFDWVDNILRDEFGLLCKGISENRFNYYFSDRHLYSRKSLVVQQVKPLKNGEVGGYVYAGHLPEYDNHEKMHKDGYMNIGQLSEFEFIELLRKVTQAFK
jgi:hypothetical protein